MRPRDGVTCPWPCTAEGSVSHKAQPYVPPVPPDWPPIPGIKRWPSPAHTPPRGFRTVLLGEVVFLLHPRRRFPARI